MKVLKRKEKDGNGWNEEGQRQPNGEAIGESLGMISTPIHT
jgi:hypothetical protein